MVAKSEASIPVSRALAKLAVATDLGTAARPSTAAPLSGPVGSSGDAGKAAAPAELPSRPLKLKPTTAWAAPVAAAERPPAAGDPGGGPSAGAACPTSAPRLPPLPLPSLAQAAATANGSLPPPGAACKAPHTLVQLPARPRSLPPGNASVASGGIGEELLETARKHPGLPPGLLSQLHQTRRAGSLPSAPPLGQAAGALDRPLSARARARATAAVVNGAAAAASASAPQPQLPPAVASLSPAALAVLLAPAELPATAGGAGNGVLTMRRAAPAVGGGGGSGGGTGAAGRPPTASGGRSGARAPSPGAAAAVAPARPAVQPHATVPYKPGSIRLPPSAGSAAAGAGLLGALPTADRPAAAGPGSLPGVAAGPGPGGTGSSRPPTSNPLTHSLAPHSATALLLRVSAPGTAAASTAPGVSASAADASAARAPGVPHAGSGPGAPVGFTKQLSADELRAVVAVLAAARPHTAALLLRRPATTGHQAAAGTVAGPPSRPGSSVTAVLDVWQRPGGSGGGATAGVGTGGSWVRLPAAWGGANKAAAGAFGGPSRPGSSKVRPRTGGSTASSEPQPRSGAVRTVSPPRPGSGGGGGGQPGSGGRRTAATGRSTARPALQPIPEHAELTGLADTPTLLDDMAAAAAGPAAAPPLEPLDPDPLLDAAWEAIVAANQRPDSAAVAAPGGSLNVFSRPGSSVPSYLRQATPMVLVLDDIAASTPEVVEAELAHMSLEQLQELRSKLMG